MIRTLDFPAFLMDWRDFPRCSQCTRFTEGGGSCWTFNPAELRAGIIGAVAGAILVDQFGPRGPSMAAGLAMAAGIFGGLYLGYRNPGWIPGNNYKSEEEASYAHAEDVYGPFPGFK